MLVFHDYQCQQCGYIQEDIAADNRRSIRRTIACSNAPCEGTAQMMFRLLNRFRHDHPRLYGRADPQISRDIVIRDYAHKQRLLRERGMIEAEDPVKGSREMDDEQPPRGPDLPVLEASSLEEIDQRLNNSTQLLE